MKKKMILSTIIIIALISIILVVYKAIKSADFDELQGINVTILGGSNMEENGRY